MFFLFVLFNYCTVLSCVFYQSIFFDINRCTTEVGTLFLSTKNKETTFKIEAFRYLSGGNYVFVECLILVCLVTDVNPECKMCLEQRKRREVINDPNNKLEEPRIIKSSMFYVVDKKGNFSHLNLNKNFSLLSQTFL